MQNVPLLYEEVEYDDPLTGTKRVRCRLTTLELGGTGTYRMGIASWRCEIDREASVQPRDARIRAPLFAEMDAYLAEQARTDDVAGGGR